MQFLDCLNAGTTVEQLLSQSADFIHRAFRPEQCALWVDSTNVSPVLSGQVFLNVSQALHKHVQATNAFVLVHNPSQDVLTSHIEGVQELNRLVAFPVRLQGKPCGSLVLSSANQINQHVQLLSLLLEKLSVALNRAQRYQDAQYSAMTDSLTGLYNKAYFLEALKNEVARSQRSQRPISLIIFDLDNFKEYNDAKGHVEGDQLLKQLGGLLKNNVRSIDVPARYGGEEFCIILPETAHEAAFIFAERFRTSVQDSFPSTVSVGIATCMNASVSPETLLKEADKALYSAKRNGKNQTRSFLIIDKAMGVIDVQQASTIGKS